MKTKEKCPVCGKEPTMQVEQEPERVVIQCEQHGYIARGQDVERAIKHWNIYIQFTKQAA